MKQKTYFIYWMKFFMLVMVLLIAPIVFILYLIWGTAQNYFIFSILFLVFFSYLLLSKLLSLIQYAVANDEKLLFLDLLGRERKSIPFRNIESFEENPYSYRIKYYAGGGNIEEIILDTLHKKHLKDIKEEIQPWIDEGKIKLIIKE